MIKLQTMSNEKDNGLFLGQEVEKLGTIVEVLGNARFNVELDEDVVPFFSHKIVLCSLSGKMSIRRIRVVLGDRVKVLVTVYNNVLGRIILRL